MAVKKSKQGWPPPKKSLGQVMLVDADIAYEIVRRTGAGEGGKVFEIGPGRGILTRYLLERGADVVCCEIDRRMADLLRKRFGGRANFRLIEEDILKFDLEQVFPGEVYQSLGNLPYHLTSGILFKFFEYIRSCWEEKARPRALSLTVMVQKEVADRLLSQPGTRGWGILSLNTRLYGDIERTLEVPASSFKPRPQVDSTVVRITFRDGYPYRIRDYELFRALIKAAFGSRRKMLKNTLARFNPPADLDFDFTRRPEELTGEDFASLANAITEGMG